MKKTAIILTIIMALFVGSMARAIELYPNCGIVTEIEINGNSRMIIITDYFGHQWAFIASEGYEIDDICAMIMNNNNTEIWYDDYIVEIRVCGRVD